MDAEIAVHLRQPLGSEPADRAQVQEGARDPRGGLLERGHRAAREVLGHVRGQPLADARHIGEPLLGQEERDVLGEVRHHPRAAPVGVHAEPVLVLELQGVGDRVEEPGNFLVHHAVSLPRQAGGGSTESPRPRAGRGVHRKPRAAAGHPQRRAPGDGPSSGVDTGRQSL